jgi:probable F420-dependent oxidoreductase
MKFGIEVVTLGEFGDPNIVVEFARAAEAAGWEALFVWDHLAFVWGVPSGEPWVILSAVAACTERLQIGVGVTPLPRRRPHLLAHTAATLDRLSAGRLVLGLGLGGVPEEFSAFGESGDARDRAKMMDEGLEVLDQLLRGQPVTHRGSHYTINGVTLAPTPVRQPRPPIWIGGESAPALRRAARWDGWIIGIANEHGDIIRSPEQLAGQIATIQQHRAVDAPFEVALMGGYSTPGDSRRPQEYADAGATWWLETLHGLRGSVSEMLERVKAGPPAAAPA